MKTRIATRFLIAPLTLGGETRWLCWARVLEEYHPGIATVHFESIPGEWVATAWA